MNVLEQLIGRVGKGSRRIQSLFVLLQPNDIPGGKWEIGSERTWLVGTSPGLPIQEPEEYRAQLEQETDFSRRARQAAGFIGCRWFKSRTRFNAVVIQIVPYASDSDAVNSLPVVAQSIVEKTYKRQEKLEEELENRFVERHHPTIPGAIFFESSGLHVGESYFVRYIYGAVGPIQLRLACSRHTEAWPWEDVEIIATKQAQKIRKSLSENRLP